MSDLFLFLLFYSVLHIHPEPVEDAGQHDKTEEQSQDRALGASRKQVVDQKQDHGGDQQDAGHGKAPLKGRVAAFLTGIFHGYLHYSSFWKASMASDTASHCS